MKPIIEQLIKLSESTQIVIYSKNHFNFYKALYKEVVGKPYSGDNIPVLELKSGKVNITVMDSDLESDNLFLGDSDDDYDYITGI